MESTRARRTGLRSSLSMQDNPQEKGQPKIDRINRELVNGKKKQKEKTREEKVVSLQVSLSYQEKTKVSALKNQ